MAEMIYRKKPTNPELKWERMRQNLEARRDRILHSDPKISNITVKKEDLDAQALSKRLRDEQDRMESIALQRYLAEQDRRHYAETLHLKHQRKKECEQLQAFRMNDQALEQRRDYDLYAPDRLKMQSPYDPEGPSVSGPSAMINFDGYKYMDPNIPVKKRQDQRAVLELQVEENRKLRENAEKQEVVQNQIETTVADRFQDDVKRMELLKNKADVEALQENTMMTEDKKRQRHSDRDAEWMQNQKEIDFWKWGDLLNEVPNKWDKHRRTHWRGITAEERTEIFRDVKDQAAAKKAKEAENQRDLCHELFRLREGERYAKTQEYYNKQRKHQQDKQTKDEYASLAKEQRDKNSYMNREVYGTNQPQEKFWNQFGRSGR